MRALFLLLLACPVQASFDIDRDKKLHAAASTLIGGVTYIHSHSVESAMVTCMSIGMMKELYDQKVNDNFSSGDLAYDAVGCALGVSAAYYVDLPLTVDYSDYSGLSLNFGYVF